MPNMEIETLQTLAETDKENAFSLSEPPYSQPQAIMAAPCITREESGFGSELGLGVQADEKGDRVCVGDAKVTDEEEGYSQNGAEQNEISIFVEVRGSVDSGKGNGESCGRGDNKGPMGENGGDPDEEFVKITGFESKMVENGDVTMEGGRKYEVNGNGNENEEDGEQDEDEEAGDDERECFVGHGSCDSGNENGKSCRHEDNKGSIGENGGESNEEFMEITGFESKMAENGDAAREGGGNYEVNGSGNVNEEDGEEYEDEGAGSEGHEYFVGDFVWGKIRGHPWWPGQVYDPSDASDYGRKYNQRERLLVAYFGDGSFSWCSPSQLKPFAECFEEMSKQSDSKSFLNALQKALEEIGRLMEVKMICSRVPEEDRIGLARPLAKNAGIKQGVLVPECDLSRLSIPQLGPIELLETLRYIAEVGSITSLLELTILRTWLSTFYQAKGGRKLAVYPEPQFVEELGDENKKHVTDAADFSGPSKEDSFSSPGQNGFDQMNQPSLRKCRGPLEDGGHHRRKKKSVAKLMREHKVIEATGKKKRKSSEEAENQGGDDFPSCSGRKIGRRKLVELLGSPKSVENKISRAKEETGRDTVSRTKNDDSDAKEEETENFSLSRKRKISKYLSPPFTNLKSMVRNSSSKTRRNSEAESLKTASNPNPQPPKEDHKKMIDSMEIDASAKEVVSEVKSAAQNPVCLREKNAVEMMGGFMSAFRSAIYVEGLNYEMYQNLRPDGKRKHLNSEASNADEASRLLFIKQKLEMMTQMLENCDGDMLAEMKPSLEGEMKGLLEKVSSMAESILS
ncbi:hypothetical protein Vadar_009083 [Vaccinium darrowii]|uniref:Uncharacterized protein n=1 Tax=Vaccinium darrowii TaxID=229202 RepID=A0ACB7XYJ4_9ERIC|nr:hypothetical protein Vadar_009083 [Vaccinium darrowii]